MTVLYPIRRSLALLGVAAFLLFAASIPALAEDGFIGIEVQELQQDMAAAIGVQETGALVRDIAFDGPGIAAGLRRGDLITAVDGQPVKTVDQLVGVFREVKVGQIVKLTGYRNRETATWTVTAGPWPGTRKVHKGAFASLPTVGITVAALTQKVRDRFKLRWQSTGLLVTLVSADAGADVALQRGDVIVQVNQQTVWHPNQLTDMYKQAKADKKPYVLLYIERPTGFIFQKLPVR